MTTIGEKADHVRAHRSDPPGGHTCHWPGCTKRVAPALWGCMAHWMKLPQELRNAIWRAYRPGQEKDKTPSPEYVRAMEATIAWASQEEARLAAKRPAKLL